MNTNTTDKKSQRTEIKNRIKNLTEEYKKASDISISNAIFSLSEYKTASFIFCYVSTENEIDTRAVIQRTWADGKRIAVPRCIRKGIMELYEIHSFNDLENGAYGILEPKMDCNTVSVNEIDFGIIPCVSCDRDRNRLGHGGGYYDRYLAQSDFVTAALCREQLMLDHVITEAHDLPVDIVISEKNIYR